MAFAPVQRSVVCGDGYRLRYRTWSPEGAPRATLVLLNGVMSHSGWFQPLAGPLVGAGLKLVGADRRGTGLNKEARGDAPSAKALVDDVKSILDAERVAGAPVHLVGWCWGAVLAINVVAEHESSFASLVLLAPGLYPTEALKRRMSDQEEVRKSNPPERPCLESPIREDMFTSGPWLASFIATDEDRTQHFSPRFHGVMTKMAMGAAARLRHVGLPMLVVLADEDRATDNAQTEVALGRLTSTKVSIEHVRSAHGIQFDAPDELARILVSWTRTATKAATQPRRNDSRAG
ncbi:alpha/beta hydrolase [Sorangium sp. So ce1335]|uniref:alpha/beta hydrolase n=1 Tax=Sorangium sp. So ce1335 TaxID=3133335 RepID=UPI003F638CA4